MQIAEAGLCPFIFEKILRTVRIPRKSQLSILLNTQTLNPIILEILKILIQTLLLTLNTLLNSKLFAPKFISKPLGKL